MCTKRNISHSLYALYSSGPWKGFFEFSERKGLNRPPCIVYDTPGPGRAAGQQPTQPGTDHAGQIGKTAAGLLPDHAGKIAFFR